jgi:hypothetical protein
VNEGFRFDHRFTFVPAEAEALLRAVPAAPGVFALRGEGGEPYLSRAADMRRRMRRLLAPPEALDADGNPVLSKRLNLRERVRSVEYTRVGSEFEAALVLYRASMAAFGAEQTRRRLRLHAPFFVRITLTNAYPRVYVTNRLSARSIAESFGPFPSRAAAERYVDAVLDLFQLRRCYEDLQPYAEHPGCVYGEMKKCMEPCKIPNAAACSEEQYAAEAERVLAFLRTRGQSMLDAVAAERDRASEAMEFEQAAALHARWERVRSAAALADELVQPVEQLRVLVVQEAAPTDDATRCEDAAVFLFERGAWSGPARLSTLGVRAVREQTAVGSSLFAQPLMLAAVPLEAPADIAESAPQQIAAPTLSPEDRARGVLAALESEAETNVTAETNARCDALSLLRRWYYRPEKQRAGESFLPNADGSWPVRRLLNGAARVVLGPPTVAAPVDREAASEMTAAAKKAAKTTTKTKVLHEGREGVEREVPTLPRRPRRKAVLPGDLKGSV